MAGGTNKMLCKGATAAEPRAKVQRWEAKPFQVSGLGDREPGSGVRVRVQVQDLNFARGLNLYLNTRARDLRAETWDLKMRMMAAGKIPVSGLPLGVGPVPTLPRDSGCDVIASLPLEAEAGADFEDGGDDRESDEGDEREGGDEDGSGDRL